GNASIAHTSVHRQTGLPVLYRWAESQREEATSVFYRRKVREGGAQGADKQDAQGRRGCPCPQPRFSGARSEVFGASEALQQNHMGLKRSGAPSVSRLGRITAFGIRSLLITSPNIRTHRNSPWKWDIRRLG